MRLGKNMIRMDRNANNHDLSFRYHKQSNVCGNLSSYFSNAYCLVNFRSYYNIVKALCMRDFLLYSKPRNNYSIILNTICFLQ